MAAEYTAALLQTVDERENVLFSDTPIPCTKGYVFHRDGSGVFRLMGRTDRCVARYLVNFDANISIPEGGTVGAISVAISLNGENLPTATAIVTPAAVEEFFNVHLMTFVDVPKGCCATIAIENITPATTGAIDVQNANLIIDKVF